MPEGEKKREREGMDRLTRDRKTRLLRSGESPVALATDTQSNLRHSIVSRLVMKIETALDFGVDIFACARY